MATADRAWEEYKRLIKDANDIVEVVQSYGVALKRSGRNWKGLCPFHREKTPSFNVNQEGQFFHCFGCGKGGDIISFVMESDRVDFREALETLGRRANIQPPRREDGGAEADEYRKWMEWKEYLFRLNAAATEYFGEQLASDAGRRAREYLKGRGISEESWRKFGLGYAPGGGGLVNHLRSKGAPDKAIERAGLAGVGDDGTLYDYFRERVIFPIPDAQGRILGFGGRVLGDGEPKYLNTRESPVFSKGKIIYGLSQARAAISSSRRAILVEGYTDVIMCHQFGVGNAVAIMGTALTRDHVRTLGRYADELVLLTDSDEAGMKASLRSLPVLLAEDVPAKVARLPGEAKDPCDFLLSEGVEAFRKALEEAKDLFDFKFEAAIAGKDLTSPRVLAEVAGDLMETAACARDALRRNILRRQVAERLRLREEDLKFPEVRAGSADSAPAVASAPVPAGLPTPAGGAGSGGAGAMDTLAAAERDLLKMLLHRPPLVERAATRVDLTALSRPDLREIGNRLLAAYAAGRLGNRPADTLAREIEDSEAQRLAIKMLAEPFVGSRMMTEDEEFRFRLKRVLELRLEARIREAERRAVAARLGGDGMEAARLEEEAAVLRKERQRLRAERLPADA
ncbi:MAG: DNA primase [Planctomycetota bacterium]|nr:DNA primase [Planctomycetota bacterium]